MELFSDSDLVGNEESYSCIDKDWLDAFPVFKESILGIAQKTQAPVELVLSVVLAVIALACQYLIDVRRPWGSVGPVSLIIFLIALSGERKTTAEKIAVDIFRMFEEGRRGLDAQRIKEWSVLWELWEKKKKQIQKQMLKEDWGSGEYQKLESALLVHANSEPVRPFVFKMVQQDATAPASSKALHQDCPSAALLTSEGDIALRGCINQVGAMNAKWDGSDIEVERVSTGHYSCGMCGLASVSGFSRGCFRSIWKEKVSLVRHRVSLRGR